MPGLTEIDAIAGTYGSDIYAAGTYKVSNSTLLHSIYAVEYCGADATLTAVKNSAGGAVGQKFITGSGIAITADMGLMIFREQVYEFITNATVKVWYAK